MKNPYQPIKDNPQRSKRLFGLEYEALCVLIDVAVATRTTTMAQAEADKIRINAPGGGCPCKLSEAEAVSLCLFYRRQHPTFEVLGLLYGVCESTAHSLYHRWVRELRQHLPCSWLEEVSEEADHHLELPQILAEHELLVDSTEQARERPKDNEAQKAGYSGKKKQHTFKNQIVSLSTGDYIVDILVGADGPCSDPSLLREQPTHFDERQAFMGDKGYQGVARTRTPVKKPRKRDLTLTQNEANREFAQDRIFIEHLIRVIKIWRIAQERFRLRSQYYVTAIQVVCGLVRLRLGRFQWTSF